MRIRRGITVSAALGGLVALIAVGAIVDSPSASSARTKTVCLVPNVERETVGAAKRAIEHNHCRLGTVTRAFSHTVAKGHVISQRPRPGAHRAARSRVSLVLSKGAPLADVGRVVAQVQLPNAPLGLFALPGAVWVAAHHGDSIYRIDPASNKVAGHVVVAQGGEQPARMILGDGTLFAVNYSGDAISLIDPSGDEVRSVIHAPLEDCCWPTYGDGSLWLLEYSSATSNPDRFVRLDPSGRVLMTMELSDAIGLTFGAGSVWGASGGQVFRLDPSTDQIVARISTDAAPTAFGAGSVWGLSSDGETLVRIDPATNSVSASIKLPAPGSVLTATDSAVWVAEGPLDSPGSRLWKIDPATNRLVGQVKLGVASVLADVAVAADGDVWVTAFDFNEVLRIRPN